MSADSSVLLHIGTFVLTLEGVFEKLRVRARLLVAAAVTATAVMFGLLAPLVPAAAYVPVEDYSSYQAPRTCAPRVKPGTKELARWIDRRFAGGNPYASLRACPSTGPSSEHHEGRAIDWSMNASRANDRREVKSFLKRLFAEDRRGNDHALARRMGVMYVIWNDRIYSSYNHFEPRDYRSSSCKKLRKCSPTLRHRDHVHISLSRPGAKARTSWYADR